MDIGTHIKKQKSFTNTMKLFYGERENANRPIQIFSGSPKSWRRPKINDEDFKDSNDFIVDTNVSVFVHSIYLLNLCWNVDNFTKKSLEYIKWEMETGIKCGFKGVVIHTGKSVKLQLNYALNNMYRNILKILEFTDPSCPLILETSSGQGTETLHEYKEFQDFYRRFTDEQRTKLKICIDTCHVFAAGHDPLDFIMGWNLKFPNSLKLVHYNDSVEKCGSKKDRHAFPGTGHIGSTKMMEIQKWCGENNIPMVME